MHTEPIQENCRFACPVIDLVVVSAGLSSMPRARVLSKTVVAGQGEEDALQPVSVGIGVATKTVRTTVTTAQRGPWYAASWAGHSFPGSLSWSPQFRMQC